MFKIHLTGANGYIGSLLSKCLIAEGFHVEKADYRLPDVPEKSIDADMLIHASFSGGGTMHKPRSGYHDPELMYRSNVSGMKALLAGLKRSSTKIISLSSTAVYGKFQGTPLLNEQAPLKANSTYGLHKIESEKILMNSPFEWMILRPSGIFGPSVDQILEIRLSIQLSRMPFIKNISPFWGDLKK